MTSLFNLYNFLFNIVKVMDNRFLKLKITMTISQRDVSSTPPEHLVRKMSGSILNNYSVKAK